MKRISPNEVLLCGKEKCCPVVKLLPDGMYEVTDDFGKTIVISKEALDMMSGVAATLGTPVTEKTLLCG